MSYDPNAVYRDTEPLKDSRGNNIDPTKPSIDIAKAGLPDAGGRIQLPHSISIAEMEVLERESMKPSPEARRAMEKVADEMRIADFSRQLGQEKSQSKPSTSKSWSINAPWKD